MQIYGNSRINQNLGLILLSIAAIIWLGWMIGNGRIDLKTVLLLLGGLLLLIILLAEQIHHQELQIDRNMLLAACLGLIIGWRSIHLFSYQIYIFPAELFIWIGFVLYLGNTLVSRQTGLLQRLPRLALLLAFFALLGIVVAALRSTPIANALDEAKSFLIFIPLIILLNRWIQSISDISRYLRAVVVIGIAIAVSGILEYFVPFVSKLSASLYNLTSNYDYLRLNFQGSELVRLSPYYLWGTPVVAVILVPLVGLWTFTFGQAKGLRKWLWAPMGAVLVGGIIVSGYRSAWLGLLATGIVMLFLDRKSFGVLVLFSIPFVVRLPFGFIERFYTILQYYQANDPSIITRTIKIGDAIQSIPHHLLWGTGWASPAVFNDWLHIAVALGLLALIILAAWYGRLMLHLMKFLRGINGPGRQLERQMAAGFLMGLAGYAVCMISGAMSQVFPIMTAFWILFCFASRFVELAENVESPIE